MIRTKHTTVDSRWYPFSIGMILVAWVVLVVWSTSPFAGLLSHLEIKERDLSPLLRLTVFVLGWTLITLAIISPSSLSLFYVFRQFVRERADRTQLLNLFILGYLGFWTLFGGVIYVSDRVLHEAVERLPLPAWISSSFTGVILLVAGIYQFSWLKYACLYQCRAPLFFLLSLWAGERADLDALNLGFQHGLVSLRCCWILILLIFVVGGISLGWLLALGAVMVAERTSRWGWQFTRPLGLILILWGGLYLRGILLAALLSGPALLLGEWGIRLSLALRCGNRYRSLLRWQSSRWSLP